MKLQLVIPKRWFNRLITAVGLLGLVGHAGFSTYLAWHDLTYPLHWTFTILAPICCLLWGMVPQLQLQTEPPSKSSDFHC
jgi:hypothetical protein